MHKTYKGKSSKNQLLRKFARETNTNLKDLKREYNKLPANKRNKFKQNLVENL